MMSKMGFWTLPVLAFICSVGQTHISAHRSRSSPLAVIPFWEAAQHIYVKAAIGGLKDLPVVIDTGSPDFVLSEKIYEQLKLPLTGMALLPSDVAGRVPNPAVMTSVPSVSFGSLTIKNVRADVLPLDDIIKARTGVETDAIIGSDLFSRYVVELDYANKVLRLYDPADYHEPHSGCRLPLKVQTHPLVHAKVLTKKGKSVNAVFFLDTGNDYSLLTNSFVASHPEVPVLNSTSERAEGFGEVGVVRGRFGRVLGIRLGECTVYNPVTIFTQNMDPSLHFSGEIGLNVFRQFTTTFDYQGRFVIFQAPVPSTGPSAIFHALFSRLRTLIGRLRR